MTGPDRDELLAAIPRETGYLHGMSFGTGGNRLDPDPRYAEPDELVERRRGSDRRRRRTFGLPLLLAACALLFALGFLVRGVVGVGL